jgi:hypothetical protein
MIDKDVQVAGSTGTVSWNMECCVAGVYCITEGKNGLTPGTGPDHLAVTDCTLYLLMTYCKKGSSFECLKLQVSDLIVLSMQHTLNVSI